ncbi:hypothetical protein AVEN_255079-1 [Araneus ventricosus]|uniref:Uncharacterized protein n=1 Tax=Araneus ventricosus TaxID=182803 RepID=A0A4Y2JZ71_ARAVE|nr:hypothetical protein AVEN_255079-1 [Araneus ventricosus]
MEYRRANVRYRTRALPFIPSPLHTMTHDRTHDPPNDDSAEHMATARAEKKEIRCPMPQNVGLPSPGISKLLQCHLNYSG